MEEGRWWASPSSSHWLPGTCLPISFIHYLPFQHGNLNTPAVDLVRLLGSCLSGKDRHEHWEGLLETFYGYLLEYLKGSPPPYTLEQVWQSRCFNILSKAERELPTVPTVWRTFSCASNRRCSTSDYDGCPRSRNKESRQFLLANMTSWHILGRRTYFWKD